MTTTEDWTSASHSVVTEKPHVALGALFYSPVYFTDASDLNTLMQVWYIGEINRWIKQRTLCDYNIHSLTA